MRVRNGSGLIDELVDGSVDVAITQLTGLRPGLIDTDMQVDTGIEDRIVRFGPTVPLGRSGTADEVAESVLWLLSDKASYVTATLYNISGGR